jgi:hypothetical protein
METLATINKEIAFIKCNRLIDKKNIIQKIKSIKEKGIIGIIFYLLGDKVVGYEIVDSHNKPVEHPENYIVIIVVNIELKLLWIVIIQLIKLD